MQSKSATSVSQPRLFAFAMGERNPDSYVVTDSNRAARDLMARWRDWPGGAALLTGPAGSGRSHLAQVWANDVGAGGWAADEQAHEAFARNAGHVLVDDADRGRDEEGLIRLFDLARASGGAVLFVAQEVEGGWSPAVADLRSRLAAAPRARLHEPDPALLSLVLQRLCRDRFLRLAPSSASFLALRLERSFAAAHALVEALDARIQTEGARTLSIAALRRVLGDMIEGYGEDDAAAVDEDANP